MKAAALMSGNSSSMPQNTSLEGTWASTDWAKLDLLLQSLIEEESPLKTPVEEEPSNPPDVPMDQLPSEEDYGEEDDEEEEVDEDSIDEMKVLNWVVLNLPLFLIQVLRAKPCIVGKMLHWV